jgi:hypothetical protein
VKRAERRSLASRLRSGHRLLTDAEAAEAAEALEAGSNSGRKKGSRATTPLERIEFRLRCVRLVALIREGGVRLDSITFAKVKLTPQQREERVAQVRGEVRRAGEMRLENRRQAEELARTAAVGAFASVGINVTRRVVALACREDARLRRPRRPFTEEEISEHSAQLKALLIDRATSA